MPGADVTAGWSPHASDEVVRPAAGPEQAEVFGVLVFLFEKVSEGLSERVPIDPAVGEGLGDGGLEFIEPVLGEGETGAELFDGHVRPSLDDFFESRCAGCIVERDQSHHIRPGPPTGARPPINHSNRPLALLSSLHRLQPLLDVSVEPMI